MPVRGPKTEPCYTADADQLRAAWQAGYEHGRAGGSRSVDPFTHRDWDFHVAWDEGWIVGAEALDQDTDHA